MHNTNVGYLLKFFLVHIFVSINFSIYSSGDKLAQVTIPISAIENVKSSKNNKLAKWCKAYGMSLITTSAIAAASRSLWNRDFFLVAFAQSAFADALSDSMDGQWEDKKNPLFWKNMTYWMSKMVFLYVFGGAIADLDIYYLEPNYGIHLGWGFASIISNFNITKKHFLDERDKKDEELQETLSKILSDPKFAQFRQQMAEKTIEVIVHNPEIVAQQIHDPVVAQNLKAICADPKLVEQFQQTFEAQLSMFMRPVLEQVTEPILPAPAPACLLDMEDDSGASSASAASTSAPEANGKQAMLQASVLEDGCTLSPELKEQLGSNARYLYNLLREEYKKDLVQMTLAIKAQQEKEANQKMAMLTQKAQEKKAQEAKSSWWPWHKSNDKKTQLPAAATLAANEGGGLLMSSSAPIEIVIDAMIAQDNSKIPGVRKGLELSDPSTGFSMYVPMHDKTSSSSSDSSPLDGLKKPLLGGSDDEV